MYCITINLTGNEGTSANINLLRAFRLQKKPIVKINFTVLLTRVT